MTFSESVQYLFQLGPELKTVKWDLDRIEALLRVLDSPHRKTRFIHVAGTNGKGSTCAMLASALRETGYRTGLYSSPHLISPLERIQLDGEPISEAVWTGVFERVHQAAEQLLAEGLIDNHPSFFETVTAMAFLAFAEARVDVVVLEVGLGGRLDATNVVLPEISVITPIDFDHESFLGSAIESIAREKAGILKAGVPAVFSSQRIEALAVLKARAAEQNCPVTFATEHRIDDLQLDSRGSSFRLGDLQIRCPLAGDHQVDNARTAAVALQLFGLPNEAIQKGIAAAVWPARLQELRSSPRVIVDGAHNPAGARALAAYIQRFFAAEPIRIIFGAMRDKALEEVTATLFPLAAEVILTAPKQPRALHPAVLLEVVDHPNIQISSDLKEALALAAEKPMTTFITGSLYLAGEALELFA